MPAEIREPIDNLYYPDKDGVIAVVTVAGVSSSKYFRYSLHGGPVKAHEEAAKWRDAERKRLEAGKPPSSGKGAARKVSSRKAAPRKAAPRKAKRKAKRDPGGTQARTKPKRLVMTGNITLPFPVPPDLTHDDWMGIARAASVALDGTEGQRGAHTQVVAAIATLYTVLSGIDSLSDSAGYHGFALIGTLCMDEVVKLNGG